MATPESRVRTAAAPATPPAIAPIGEVLDVGCVETVGVFVGVWLMTLVVLRSAVGVVASSVEVCESVAVVEGRSGDIGAIGTAEDVTGFAVIVSVVLVVEATGVAVELGAAGEVGEEAIDRLVVKRLS